MTASGFRRPLTVRVWRFVLDGVLPRFAVASVVAALLYPAVYFWVVPPVVWGQYRKEMKHHVLEPPAADHGAGSSDIAYLTMTFDCAEGDVVIAGTAPPAPYWQMGIYDVYVRAVQGGHLNHRTATVAPDGTFRVRITRDFHGEPDTLDCSQVSRGIFMYRVVLPTGTVPTPTVTVAPRAGS